MYSQKIFRTDSTESTSKKTNRALYILGFIEFIFVSICLLLLLLNQNLNKVIDDYSPAYRVVNDDDNHYNEQDSTTLSTSNSPHTTSEEATEVSDAVNNLTTNPQSTAYSEKQQTLNMLFPTKNPTIHETTMHEKGNDMAGFFDNHLKTYNDSELGTDENRTVSRHVKMNETMAESATERPLNNPKTAMNLRPEQEEEWIEVFISNLLPGSAVFKFKREEDLAKGNNANNVTQTRLHHLLIMYPCCVSAMILLWMQLISRLMNDDMLKSTMITFISICIALGTTIFAVSVLESMNQKNSIAILIAVSSAIFVILEVIDFILLFVVM